MVERITTTVVPAAITSVDMKKRHLAKDSPDLFRKYGRKLDTVVVATSTGSPCVITAFVS